MRIARKRAVIHSGFIELLQKVALQHLEFILAQAKRQNSAKRYLQVHKHSLVYLTPIVEGDKKAIDTALIKMHSMDYTHYGVDRYKSCDYFWAQTSPIIARNVHNRNGSRRSNSPDYELGTYQVYLNADMFTRSSNSSAKPHFIPNEEPCTTRRHPHCTATHSSARDGVAKCHPLDMSLNICWGSFGPLMSAAKSDRDVVEYFNLVHMYLSRWTPNDTLAGPRSIPFSKEYRE